MHVRGSATTTCGAECACAALLGTFTAGAKESNNSLVSPPTSSYVPLGPKKTAQT